MPLSPGTTLGPYQVTAKIGEGGMGEVYRARDTKLDRDVALKVLPQAFTDDPDRLARFEREAKVLASLNHPKIGSIYGLEEAEGQKALVLELVEGPTLAERITQGPIPVDEALPIAKQIAEALEAAHEQGIIHRDLKPANIKLTPKGRVKVLDFGLARSQGRQIGSDDETQVSALTQAMTAPGTVVGTPAYMSPEQVRGQPLDRRTDVWAFGCVLYELLTAERAFRGATVPDTLATVLQRQPAWRDMPETVPRQVTNLLRKCLEKIPADRWTGFAEVFEELTRPVTSASVPARGSGAKIGGLVVLPLRNLSGDPDQEFFADGMTEALTWELAKLQSLRVISRTSAMRFKTSERSLPEIAEELNVDAVVEGSVVRSGDRVLIRAQLVDASTDTTQWREGYDRPLKDVLALQSEIALAIAREIDVVVTPEEQRRLAQTRVVDPAAYDAYLKGQFHWAKFTPPDLELALEYFEQAARREPALGHAGIALVWGARRQMGLAEPHESGRLAKEAAEKALAADETLAETHYAVAISGAWIDWDWERAESGLRRALEIRPGFAEAHAYLSHLLICVNRPDEALAEMNKALEIDPNNKLFRSLSGIVLVAARRFDEAIRLFRKAKKTSPGSPVINRGLHSSFHMKGMFEEALAESHEWFALQKNEDALAALERGNTRDRYEGAMYEAAEVLARQSREHYLPPLDIGRYYACAGRKDKVLDLLDLALDKRDADLPYIGWAVPHFDLVRHEPRFRDILGRLNLPLA